MAINYDVIFASTDETPFDPCVAYNTLLPGYMMARTGGRPLKVLFRDREVWFDKTDIKEWHSLMSDLVRQCREKKGLGSGRFAITAG